MSEGARQPRIGPLGLALAIIAAVTLSAAGGSWAAEPPPREGKGGVGNSAAPPRSVPLPGQYIVTLKPGVDSEEFAALERGRGNRVDRVYSHALNGYAGALAPGEVARLSRDPRVARIEQDATITIDTTQTTATWGIDRIDQRLLPLSTTYDYSTTAPDVTVYIIDTGIRATHSDFGGRVVAGYDAIGGVSPPTDDCHGHGTHVAGTVGGATYGVAKGVRLVAVRVLDCNGSGSESGVISGIDWVTANHPAGAPAVANMSLGGSAFPTLDDAVTASIADGVVYAVAAGNSGTDACTTSPARTPNALTVAATSDTDARPSFSNFGSCVDLFAPGVGITSDWNSSDNATNTISGTSMATPHVAGVAALIFSSLGAGATADQVSEALLANTTPGIVTNPGSGSPNRLLYVGTEPVPPPPPPPPPPANDAFVDAVMLNGASGSVTGSTANATKEVGEPNHAGNAGGASIWYEVTPTASGTATFDTLGSDFDTLLGVYTGDSVNALTTMASNDDIAYPFLLQSSVSLSVTAGVTYRIAVDGWNGANGSMTLTWSVPVSSTPPPPPPPASSLSVADASVVEGKTGKRTMQFIVSLSAPAATTVSASFSTVDGTATAGSDYLAKSGTVSISAGATTATISINVKGDRIVEPDETFFVHLSNPTGGAAIADDQGVGTIVNDD